MGYLFWADNPQINVNEKQIVNKIKLRIELLIIPSKKDHHFICRRKPKSHSLIGRNTPAAADNESRLINPCTLIKSDIPFAA